MSKEKKNMMFPELQFPEFQNGKEWKEVSLGEIGETLSGLSGKSGPDFGQGRPFVTYMQVFKNAWIDLNECGKVILHENEKQNELQYGDILITTSSETPEEVGFASVLLVTPKEPVYLNSFCFAFRPYNLKELIPSFSRHLFRSPSYRKLIGILAQGSTRFNISKGAFLNLKLTIPKNETEQQKIASCLSSLDDLITAHTQKLDALKAHKKGLMQQLFPEDGEKVPKRRFEEFKNAGDWIKISLIDTADKNIKWSFTGGPFGSNLKSSDYVSNGVRVIQLQNIGDGEFIDEYKIFTSEEKADELLSCNIYPDEIILSKMGDPVGRACLIPHSSSRYVMCSDGIRVVVDEKQFNKYFIYSLINSKHFRPLVEKAATGSTRKRIGLDDLKNLPMIVPAKLEEQEKIASVFYSLDNIIIEQAEKIEQLKLHKRGLMQGLFPDLNSNKNG